jgi:hypothetical protein
MRDLVAELLRPAAARSALQRESAGARGPSSETSHQVHRAKNLPPRTSRQVRGTSGGTFGGAHDWTKGSL